MKLKFGNFIIGASLVFFKVPNEKKLEQECIEYFKSKYPNNKNNGISLRRNEIGGLTILNYELENFRVWMHDGTDNDLEVIGKKYGLKNFGFPYWYYPK